MSEVQEKINAINDGELQKVARAYADGTHAGIEFVIGQIELIEMIFNASGGQITEDFKKLKNNLGIVIYKNWPNKD